MDGLRTIVARHPSIAVVALLIALAAASIVVPVILYAASSLQPFG